MGVNALHSLVVVQLRLSSRYLRLFSSIPVATDISTGFPTKSFRENPWPQCNSMIRASIQKGSPEMALFGFRTILRFGTFRPDHCTLCLILEACRMLSDLRFGMSVHGRISKDGLEAHGAVASSLFSLYLNSSRLDEARQFFDEMPERDDDPFYGNLMIASYLRIGKLDKARFLFDQLHLRDLITWNSMIAGYAKSSQPQEAICFFEKMIMLGFQPDGFTFSTVLSACARVGALKQGEWIHSLMFEKGIETNYILDAALIDMFSKCGRVEMGKKIFESSMRSDVSVWNSMISGLAIHGLGFDALKLFVRMEKEDVSPDKVTFVSLLNACSHCGLVQEGRRCFDIMQQRYSIKPFIEHYGSLVDLLARAGHLEEAYSTIKEMPMEPDIVVWRTLLSGCRTYQEPKLGEIATRNISGNDSGDYVLLSNIYALTNRQHCAQSLWEVMKKRKIRKERGLSWVELEGRIHEFKAGERSHPEFKDIQRVLSGLNERIKGSGYAPKTELVTMDVLEEEKEENLSGHSEKLAVAYAVLKTSPLTEIRVSKNLRTCKDCHSWLKMVSSILCRMIIVRDRVRFHRFEDGSCSCRDYW